MKKKKNIKILTVFHKPYIYLKNDIIIPIHAGRDISFENSKDGNISKTEYNWLLKHTTGDNTGDNISKYNRSYCEITAVYWAWKNYDKIGNPDYIGLMHYRTFFDLFLYAESKKLKLDDFCFNHEVLDSLLDDYDGVCMEKWNWHKITGKDTETKETFRNYIYVIQNIVPELNDSLNLLLDTANLHYKSMFILKKEDFFKYCELLFKACFWYQENGFCKPDRGLGYRGEILSSMIFDYFMLKHQRKFYLSPILTLPENYKENKLQKQLNYKFYSLKRKIFKSKKEHYDKKLEKLNFYKSLKVNICD